LYLDVLKHSTIAAHAGGIAGRRIGVLTSKNVTASQRGDEEPNPFNNQGERKAINLMGELQPRQPSKCYDIMTFILSVGFGRRSSNNVVGKKINFLKVY